MIELRTVVGQHLYRERFIMVLDADVSTELLWDLHQPTISVFDNVRDAT